MSAPTRLSRRLGLGDAVVIGLGAMIGAGVFTALGAAVGALGPAALIALVLAGTVAALNATSVARLARVHPVSGGVYAYAGARLGPGYGFAAGWAFVCGKIGSAAAMALTFANHVAEEQRWIAPAAALAMAGLDALGVKKTVRATQLIVSLVVLTLIAAMIGLIAGGQPQLEWEPGVRPGDVLTYAAMLFFAFAGYARVATLGEEVIEPDRTLPRAIAISLGAVLGLYLAVTVVLVVFGDRAHLAGSSAPLVTEGPLGAAVRAGAALASLGVLLSLLSGLGRTVFAMASNGDLPRGLAAVSARTQAPSRATWAIAILVAALAAIADVRQGIGLSAFSVLLYYALGHASAARLPGAGRVVPWLGGLACLALALSLPGFVLLWGSLALAVGLIGRRALASRARAE